MRGRVESLKFKVEKRGGRCVVSEQAVAAFPLRVPRVAKNYPASTLLSSRFNFEL